MTSADLVQRGSVMLDPTREVDMPDEPRETRSLVTFDHVHNNLLDFRPIPREIVEGDVEDTDPKDLSAQESARYSVAGPSETVETSPMSPANQAKIVTAEKGSTPVKASAPSTPTS